MNTSLFTNLDEEPPPKEHGFRAMHLESPLRGDSLWEARAYLERKPHALKKMERRDLDILVPLIDASSPLHYDYTRAWIQILLTAAQPDLALEAVVGPLTTRLTESTRLCLSVQLPSIEALGGTFDITRLTWTPTRDEAKLNALQLAFADAAQATSTRESRPSGILKDAVTMSHDGLMISITGEPGLGVHLTESFCLFQTQAEQILVSRDQFLCISDLLHQRYLIHEACRLGKEVGSQLYPTEEELKVILSWGDAILEECGNSGFDLISKWEALCTGVMQRLRPDPLVNNGEFLSTMMDDFDETAAKIGSVHRSQGIVHYLHRLGERNPHLVSQAFGLYRLWGHPVVHPLRGVQKLKDIACCPKLAHALLVAKAECKVKEIFSLNYYAKHRRWPQMDLEKLPAKSFLRNRIEHGAIISRRHPKYRLLDWGEITFKKNFEVMENLDLSDMISDKATSLNLEELQAQIKSKHTIGASWERALLVQHCKQEETSPQEILDHISKFGFGDQEVVVGTCPKERELKSSPRMFGLLTLRKRMYVVITEAMLAHDILPYFPDITMMDDSITLTKKIIQMTSKGESLSSIITTLDFEKWNSHMRKDETLGIFKFFDDLYGMENVFTRSHEMFEGAQLYLADSCYLPSTDPLTGKLKEDEGCWSGHLGGIEGLRQKGWTIFTNAILRLVADDHNLSVHIMGQGDNQVMKCSFPSDKSEDWIKDRHSAFFQHLVHTTTLIGPPLKVSETWSSSRFFIYGKYPVLDGVPLSMSLKRLARIFPLCNDGFPSIDISLSSIFANVSAALQHETSPIVPYLVGTLEAAWAITIQLGNSPLHPTGLQDKLTTNPSLLIPQKDSKSLRIEHPVLSSLLENLSSGEVTLLTALLMFPKTWGGFSVQLLGSLMARGHPDLATLDCSLIRQAWEESPPELRTLLERMLSPVLNPSKNSTLLIQDPTALNLLSPSSASDTVKRLVTHVLKGASWITNPKIKEFLNISCDGMDTLCDYLVSMSPCNPRVGHSILEASLYGRSLHMINQLNKTNTVIKISRNLSNVPLTSPASKADLQHWLSVLHHLSTAGEEWHHSVCSSQWTQHIRNKGWATEITGVTVASPFEMFVAAESETAQCEEEGHMNAQWGYILLRRDPSANGPLALAGLTLGPYTPYIGSKTIEKVAAKGKEWSKHVPSLVSQAYEIQVLQGWGAKKGGHLSQVLDRLVTSLCNKDPQRLYPLHEHIKGSLEHRFLDNATKHGGALPVLYTVATAWYISSDTLSRYSKGSGNYNLHFQSTYGCVLGCLATQARDSAVAATLHLHQKCRGCCSPIFEGFLELPAPPISIEKMIPSKPDNPFCWVNLPEHSLSDAAPYPRMDPSQLEESSLRRRFSWRVGRELCHQLREAASGFNMVDAPVLKKTVPVPWTYKSNPVDVVESFVFFLTAHLARGKKVTLLTAGVEQGLAEVLDEISTLPTAVFSHMADLESRTEFFFPLTRGPYYLNSSGGVPPSPAESAANWRAITVDVLSCWLFQGILPPMLMKDINCVGDPRDLDWHPSTLATFATILQDHPAQNPQALERWVNWTAVHRMAHHLQSELGLERSQDIIEANIESLTPCQIRTAKAAREGPQYQLLLEEPDLLAKRLSLFHETVDMQVPTINLNQVPGAIIVLQGASTVDLDTSPLGMGNTWPKLPDLDTCNSASLLKTDGSHTIAPYKLLSLKPALPESIRSAACLGEGAGGILATLGRIYPDALFFYNSLIDPSRACSQTLPSLVPPSVLPIPGLRERLVGLNFTIDINSDLTESSYARKALRAVPGPFDLITCDAEGGGWESPKKGLLLAQTVTLLAAGWKANTVIFKTYGSSPRMVACQIALLLAVFDRVTPFRSQLSSPDNSEIYLIGKHPHRIQRNRVIGEDFCAVERGIIPSILRRIEQELLTFDYASSHASPRVTLKLSAILETEWSKSRVFSILNRHCPGGLWKEDCVAFPGQVVSAVFSRIELVKGQRRRVLKSVSPGLLTRPIVRGLFMSFLPWIIILLEGLPEESRESIVAGVSLIAYHNIKSKTVVSPVVLEEPDLIKLTKGASVFGYYLSSGYLDNSHLKVAYRTAGSLKKVIPDRVVLPESILNDDTRPKDARLIPHLSIWRHVSLEA
ncbi:putative RdRp protein [IRE/CTVM19-associated rhabdovirus]|nr:putative RdRp protein [IRE/CTVM19-associated rhabdovirus]